MVQNYIPFDKEALKNVKKLNEEIEEMKASEEIDGEKLQKLYELFCLCFIVWFTPSLLYITDITNRDS